MKQVIHTMLSMPEMRWDNRVASGLDDMEAGGYVALGLTVFHSPAYVRTCDGQTECQRSEPQ